MAVPRRQHGYHRVASSTAVLEEVAQNSLGERGYASSLSHQAKTNPGKGSDYTDRQWESAWAAGTAGFMQESYLDVDQRAAFFQYAYSSAHAMVIRTIGESSKYPFTLRDKDGQLLNGSHTYKLNMPANISAGCSGHDRLSGRLDLLQRERAGPAKPVSFTTSRERKEPSAALGCPISAPGSRIPSWSCGSAGCRPRNLSSRLRHGGQEADQR